VVRNESNKKKSLTAASNGNAISRLLCGILFTINRIHVRQTSVLIAAFRDARNKDRRACAWKRRRSTIHLVDRCSHGETAETVEAVKQVPALLLYCRYNATSRLTAECPARIRGSSVVIRWMERTVAGQLSGECGFVNDVLLLDIAVASLWSMCCQITSTADRICRRVNDVVLLLTPLILLRP